MHTSVSRFLYRSTSLLQLERSQNSIKANEYEVSPSSPSLSVWGGGSYGVRSTGVIARTEAWDRGAYISGGSVWRYCLNKGIDSYLSKRRLSEDKVNFALGTCTESILRKNFRSVISDDTRYRKFATIKSDTINALKLLQQFTRLDYNMIW